MRPAMVRNIDSQGRIIIPTEIRRTMNLSDGDALEIRPTDSGILLTKYTAQIRDPDMKKYLETLYSVIRCSAAICSEEYVLAVKGIRLREGMRISAQLAEYLRNRELAVLKGGVYATDSKDFPVDTLIPVTAFDFSPQPMALLLFQNEGTQVTEEERLCARIMAAFISARAL